MTMRASSTREPMLSLRNIWRISLRCAGPGQEPRDRIPLEFSRQCPQRRQRARAGPLQVIQAHQDRSDRSTLLEMPSYPADPPRGRIPQIAVIAVSCSPVERIAQGHAQREERDRPAQLVGGSRRQREALSCCLVGGLMEQPGLADARLSLDQHHTAKPAPSAAQQAADDLPGRIAPPHHSIVGGTEPWRHQAVRPRRGIIDYRCHIDRVAPHLRAVSRIGPGTRARRRRGHAPRPRSGCARQASGTGAARAS